MNDHAPVDLIVYSGTPAGITSAVAAARRGLRVRLLEPTRHVGGLSTSGLNTSEIEHMLPESWGGLQQEFLLRVGRRYNIEGPLHRWESRVAEAVFVEMLDEAGVHVLYQCVIDSASVEGGRIRSVIMTDGSTFAARAFIDASYEGDLAHRAGVTMTFGRESRETYHESLAGQRFVETHKEVESYEGWSSIDEAIPARTVDDDGNLLPYFTPSHEITVGSGDHRVMNYNFRVTVSTADDRIPFSAPPHYDPDDFANLADWLKTIEPAGLGSVVGVMDHPSGSYVQSQESTQNPRRRKQPMGDVIDVYPHPSGQYHKTPSGLAKPVATHKWELNNKQNAVWSLGHFGGQFGWPDGSHDERQRIWDDHYRHNMGLLYFLSTDRSVPQAIREDTNRFGLAVDEYADNGHWPYQLYVREARRMVGEYVMTEHDILTNRHKPDAIMLGSHWIDCHHVQRVAIRNDAFRNEGRIWKQIDEPYGIPYAAILPKLEQVDNLLVPVAVSASHVAYCSIRLESIWMLLGHAAGEAAALAIDGDSAMGAVNVAALQDRLREGKVTLAM